MRTPEGGGSGGGRVSTAGNKNIINIPTEISWGVAAEMGF
jgi:hypothetical protein